MQGEALLTPSFGEGGGGVNYRRVAVHSSMPATTAQDVSILSGRMELLQRKDRFCYVEISSALFSSG